MKVLKAMFLVLITTTILITAEGYWDHRVPADLAIVPGNMVDSTGHPSHRLQARLDETAKLYKAGIFPLIFVSGSMDHQGFSEARVMADALIAQGIPARNILIDESGNTTYLTAKHAATLMRQRGMQKAFVVTQFFHIARTRLALWRFGVSSPGHAHATFFEWRDLYALCREIPANYVYALRSYKNR